MTEYHCLKCNNNFRYMGCFAKLKCPKCYSRNVMTKAGWKKLKQNKVKLEDL